MTVRIAAITVAVALMTAPVDAERKAAGKPVLWRQGSVASRDLIYGAGGREHLPKGPFRFEKEDMKASSPKYDLVDASGVKWKVKLGQESRSETAASRRSRTAG